MAEHRRHSHGAYGRSRISPMRISVVAVLTLAAVVSLAGCAQLHPQPPVVAFRGVSLRNVALNGATLDVALQVANPNPFNIDVQRITYSLFVDSTLVGTGTPDSKLFVASKDSGVVTLPVTFTYGGLGNVALQLLSRGAMNYRITGQVSFGTPVGTLTRDFDQKGTYSPTIPR